jgi:hypothetical protein
VYARQMTGPPGPISGGPINWGASSRRSPKGRRLT